MYSRRRCGLCDEAREVVEVVSRDVPDYAVVVGNPARVVKERARIKYTYVPATGYRPPLIQ